MPSRRWVTYRARPLLYVFSHFPGPFCCYHLWRSWPVWTGAHTL
jgi:hypothetical protein